MNRRDFIKASLAGVALSLMPRVWSSETPVGMPLTSGSVKDGLIGWIPPDPAAGDMNTSYGASPFLQGDRIFMRTRTHLLCVGDPAKPWHTPASAPKEARVQ